MEILGLMRHEISGAVVQILSSFVRQKTVGKGEVKSFSETILSRNAEFSKALNLNVFSEHFFSSFSSFVLCKSLSMISRLNNFGTAQKSGEIHGDPL